MTPPGGKKGCKTKLDFWMIEHTNKEAFLFRACVSLCGWLVSYVCSEAVSPIVSFNESHAMHVCMFNSLHFDTFYMVRLKFVFVISLKLVFC